MVPRTAAPWTRRVPGVALLLFFVSLIAFTYLAVYSWNVYAMELTGLFTALASAAPLLIVYVFYVARPIWALPTPADEAAVEQAVRDATRSTSLRSVAEREGPFRMCVAVVEVADPRCTVGWLRGPVGSAVQPSASTTILLLARSGDRKGLARLRTAISDALVRAPTGPVA